MSEIKSSLDENNPFSKESTLPLQAPAFDKIKNTDFKPAFEEGMRIQLLEMEQIANNSETATFENTLVAMEKSGQLLSRVSMVFNLLSSANTNPVLQALQEEIAPKLAAHQDAIYMNDKLFQRVKTLYNTKEKQTLTSEEIRLIEYYYNEFVSNGANLSAKDKDQLKQLNAEEANLSAKFGNMLVAAAKVSALTVDDKAALAGLSENELQAYENGGKWTVPLQNTTQQPDLQSLTNRETRRQLFEKSWNRNELNDTNDTRAIILKLANIRSQKAKMLGYDNYAAWKLVDQMAKTPQAVDQFFAQLVPSATAKARKEAAEIQRMIDKTGGKFQLEPYDWNLYAEMVRKEKYDLNDEQIKPYFELNTVLEKGVFYAANQLYGLNFKERKDLPVYQKDVRVFDVFNEDGSQLGLFYCDYFKRDNKSGGAWMDNLVGQSFLFNTKPVIYNVCNFTKPAAGQPALISFDDVTTMFHEFGHALHGLFSNQKFPSISGTNTARDFVEFPSQFNENWALYPSVLKNYALHYQTGETIPQSLVDKIKKASTFNQGYALTEVIAAAALDMEWHKIAAGSEVNNVDTFENQALRRTQLLLHEVPSRYRSSYFLHIWSNGYSAGYYAYLWTEMLSHDAYAWFEENGQLSRANGDRFRKMILSIGNSRDLKQAYIDFRGKEPSISYMQKSRGLVE
jgi:peptidyl-dipeptidase Dcp